jgi:hypothetical protein
MIYATETPTDAILSVRAKEIDRNVRRCRGERLPADMNSMSDRRIRGALRIFVVQRADKDSASVVIDELSVGSETARVDLAVLGDSFHGYEIKSELDSLRRLSRQVEAYSSVFDFATIVVAPKHYVAALQAVPSWWEVVTVLRNHCGEVVFEPARHGCPNPAVNVRALVQLMWRDEALHLLESKGYASGWQSKEKWRILDRICELIAPDEIRDFVRESVKERGARRAAQLLH